VLRGALDGLGAVDLSRPEWIGRAGSGLMIDGKTRAAAGYIFKTQSRRCPTNLYRMYKAEQASIVHATATAMIERRSHFRCVRTSRERAQPGPAAVDTGWLNLPLVALEAADRWSLRGTSRDLD